MKLVMDSLDGSVPKRGDIIQTNVGNRRERTCMILRVHHVHARRYHIWAERWWQLEADFRMRLFHSSERNGGQQSLYFRRYKAKKRPRLSFVYFENEGIRLDAKYEPQRGKMHAQRR